ncbi:MAG: M14 family metallopeptidase [Gemmatimonadaceae bacterium]
MFAAIRRSWRGLLVSAALAARMAHGQAHVTSPTEQFDHVIGDDYWLATYDQLSEYWHKLARESDRMKVVDIGPSAEGRRQLMAIVSSAANLKQLDQYRRIARRLALADDLTDDQAHSLAEQGKAVVWIDGGLHASEVLGAHQLMETVYQLVSRNDPETRRILSDCIILAVHANPDGMQLVSSWYMAERDTLKRNLNIPRLYQKYVGHDNNRDFYVSNQTETRNMNHVMYWEWFPQIVYNHHQTGPAGAVMFSPPFRDPFNYNFDPLVVTGIDLVGAAMHDRFEREGKPGVVMRSGSTYSTWWNGGLRTTAYFHNMIGLLTETIGSPTPQRIPFVPAMTLPRGDVPYPIAPGIWHFRQSIDYSVTANYAVLDLASRYRDELLFDIYRMGRNSIERGSHASWTPSPRRLAAVESTRSGGRQTTGAGQQSRAGMRRTIGRDEASASGAEADPTLFTTILHDSAQRDARGYILPSDQPDFLTATKFVNTLRHVGVQVNRAKASFSVKAKRYPAGSYVVKTAQAFRPYVLDMFEPQDHPNDFAYIGGPPTRPYDNAGYTLAYQMGVHFDRVLDGFDGPFERIEGLAVPPSGTVSHATGAVAFLFTHEQNDAFAVINRLLKHGDDVFWLTTPLTSGGQTFPARSFYVSATPSSIGVIRKAAADLGVCFVGTTTVPVGARRLHPKRIALADQYGGSIPSGQIRWLFEQFDFPYTIVFPNDIDAGNLRAKYDVIVLPSGALGAAERQVTSVSGPISDVPASYQYMLGQLTEQSSVPELRRFIDDGGTVLAIGTSAKLGGMLGLPLSNALVERTGTGAQHPLSAEKFYVPGSILRVAVDTSDAVAAGEPTQLDVFYDNSPAFRLGPDAGEKGVRRVAWFDSDTPLRSGWAWGQHYLKGAVAIADVRLGRGRAFLFAPEITFRAQPHGTFKLLFNGIYAGDGVK